LKSNVDPVTVVLGLYVGCIPPLCGNSLARILHYILLTWLVDVDIFWMVVC